MYDNRENRFNKVAPVKEGEELDVKIEALGEKGDGIAKKNGFVLVIPGTQVNDEVKVKITKVLRKVGFAEVIGKATGPVKVAKKADEEGSEDEASEESEESVEEESSEEDLSDEELEEDAGEDSEDFGEEEQEQ
jgi:predicted RNA-binding protein with TRAM domain